MELSSPTRPSGASLLSLPKELKDMMIYEYLINYSSQYVALLPHRELKDNLLIRHSRVHISGLEVIYRGSWDTVPSETSLHRVCRQLRTESLAWLYGKMSFVFDPDFRRSCEIHPRIPYIWLLKIAPVNYMIHDTKFEIFCARFECRRVRYPYNPMAEDPLDHERALQSFHIQFWPCAFAQCKTAASLMPSLRSFRIIVDRLGCWPQSLGDWFRDFIVYDRRLLRDEVEPLYIHTVALTSGERVSSKTQQKQHPLLDVVLKLAAMLRVALARDGQFLEILEEISLTVRGVNTFLLRRFQIAAYNWLLDTMKGTRLSKVEQNAAGLLRNDRFELPIPCRSNLPYMRRAKEHHLPVLCRGGFSDASSYPRGKKVKQG